MLFRSLLDALRFGASDYISKPFEIATIRAAVRKAMQRRRLKRETTVAREEAGSNMAKYRELQTRPLRIVHVDDGDAVLQFVAHSIRSEFDNVVIATFHNGYEALQEVLREEPDLLISDLVRDGLVDGFTLLRLLDSMNVSCPILIASGNLPKAQAEAVQCAGPKLNVTFWPKPFNTSELLEFIRTKINPALLKARGR